MARVVLHIGTHKTGTTTIQHVFARNREILQEAGLIYPEVGRQPGHHALIAPWVNLPAVFHVGDDPDPLWVALAERHAGDEGVVFLSSEEFSRATKNRRVDFGHVRKLLAGFEGVSVVCVLRDQASFLQSVFLEVAKKASQPPSWQSFFTRSLASDLTTGLHLDYNNLYDQLRADFAEDEIAFVSYNDACVHPDGLVGDMLERMGTRVSAGELTGNRSVNVSPEPLAGWMAAAMAEKEGAPPVAVEAAVTALRATHGSDVRTTIYTREELDAVLAKYQAPNATFEHRIRERDPNFRFPDCRIGPDWIGRDRLDEIVWIRFAREIYYRLPDQEPI